MPPVIGQPFEALVPKPDADGLDLGGIRLPEMLVPLGTRMGFNTRTEAAGFPWATGRWDGSFVPFARTEAERQAAGDPRPSLAARYADRTAYEAKVRAAAADVVGKGFLLPDDVDAAGRGRRRPLRSHHGARSGGPKLPVHVRPLSPPAAIAPHQRQQESGGFLCPSCPESVPSSIC